MAHLDDNIELQMLLNIKENGYNYKERRLDDWRENYQLARDKVTINRLTQRQSVNIPLMKTVLKTVLKDIDDMPNIEFQNLDNDKQAELFQNEYWTWTLEQNNADIQDIVDKKQDFFMGRSFDSWQIENGSIIFDIEDPEDILVDRFMNPYDLNSSRFLVHTHIFRPLSSLKNNKDYDQSEVKKLEDFFESKLGIIKAKDNENSLQQKNRKLAEMGVPDTEDPVVGETYVEMTMTFVFRDKGEKWTDYETGKKHKTEEEQIFVYMEAEEQTLLMKKPQEVIIGKTKDNWWRNHYRYHSWGSDIDNQDFWTDGLGDVVRTPNKILNSFFSQLVENRTLRNFGMHYYDSSLKADGFVPSTFEARPWGWYPVPGKPSDVMEKVDIPDLSESLDEMNFITDFVRNATGAVAPKQGAQTPGDKTKFEINAILTEATERIQGVSKFYTHAWKQRAMTFLKLIEAASTELEAVKIYSEGKNNDEVFEREISPSDWMTKAGYKVKVWSQDEKRSKDSESINRLSVIMAQMPDNPKLREVFQRKLLEFADLTPEEITQIMEFESQKMLAIQNGTILPTDQQALPTGGQPPVQI